MVKQGPSKGQVIFAVNRVKDLIEKIIPFFEKYPLLTQKQADFQLFSMILKLIAKKEHLTLPGLIKIVSIRASMNRGLTPLLLSFFSDIIPVARPKVEIIGVPNPNWYTGFCDAECCFHVRIRENSTSRNKGLIVSLMFSLVQHSRDTLLFELLKNYLNCGKVYISNTQNDVRLKVEKFSDIYDIIIPFFEKYPLQSSKKKDFLDFCKVANLIKDKSHLTDEGLKMALEIKSGMNTGRKHTPVS